MNERRRDADGITEGQENEDRMTGWGVYGNRNGCMLLKPSIIEMNGILSRKRITVNTFLRRFLKDKGN